MAYQVLAARDAAEALHIARERDGAIDLLDTDVIMPGMHGPALGRQLVEDLGLKRVLYMSGYPDLPQVEQPARAVVGFIGKPFSPVELAVAVRQSLDAAEGETIG